VYQVVSKELLPTMPLLESWAPARRSAEPLRPLTDYNAARRFIFSLEQL
jgi:hypothetical protein